MNESAECPVCSGAVNPQNPVMGELLYCSDCSTELEVIGITPLQLQEAPSEGEDWGQ